MQFDAHDTQMISGLPCKNDNSHDNALLYKFTRDEKRKHFFFHPPLIIILINMKNGFD